MNKTIIAIFIFFILLGVMFFSYFVHETFHVFHMKEAEAICVSLGAKMNDSLQSGYLFLYTEYNLSDFDNIETYNTLREQSEKMALVISDSLELILGIAIGIMFAYIYYDRKRLRLR